MLTTEADDNGRTNLARSGLDTRRRKGNDQGTIVLHNKVESDMETQ